MGTGGGEDDDERRVVAESSAHCHTRRSVYRTTSRVYIFAQLAGVCVGGDRTGLMGARAESHTRGAHVRVYMSTRARGWGVGVGLLCAQIAGQPRRVVLDPTGMRELPRLARPPLRYRSAHGDGDRSKATTKAIEPGSDAPEPR